MMKIVFIILWIFLSFNVDANTHLKRLKLISIENVPNLNSTFLNMKDVHGKSYFIYVEKGKNLNINNVKMKKFTLGKYYRILFFQINGFSSIAESNFIKGHPKYVEYNNITSIIFYSNDIVDGYIIKRKRNDFRDYFPNSNKEIF